MISPPNLKTPPYPQALHPDLVGLGVHGERPRYRPREAGVSRVPLSVLNRFTKLFVLNRFTKLLVFNRFTKLFVLNRFTKDSRFTE